MKRKKALALFMSAAVLSTMLAGCGDKGGGEQSSTPQSSQPEQSTGSDQGGESQDSQNGGGTSADVIAFEDIQFPENMPSQISMAEDGYYDYDDMSQHYDLEFFTYNYGVSVPDNDPIKAWLEEKYNVTITLTTCLSDDVETQLSTRFADQNVPDLMSLPSNDYAISLGEQGLLVDGKEMYPYMPQTCKYVTQTLIKYSTLPDGTIPYVTKYAIQDSDIWNVAVRQDWLDNLNMEMPKTLDDFKEFARACTFDDPDGNGKDDTWFMTGVKYNQFNGFQPWFGNPYVHEENGVLVSPMLDGSTRDWIAFCHELYEMEVLAPDWFTIDWETSKSYTLGDKVGLVCYPSANLFDEYTNAHDGDRTIAGVWSYLEQLPQGKGTAGGSPGNMWAIPKKNVEGDQGKMMRILHILDAMCVGGEAFLETVQGGGNEVHDGYDGDVREYTENGTFYCYVNPKEHPGFTGVYGNDNLALAPWQNFGYTLKWRDEYCPDDTPEEEKIYFDKLNESAARTASYDRWTNANLLAPISADIGPNVKEFQESEHYKFITGERSMDEWDDYVQEYLANGGLDQLKAKAEVLGCALPEGLE